MVSPARWSWSCGGRLGQRRRRRCLDRLPEWSSGIPPQSDEGRAFSHVAMEGHTSNRDAIGARVAVHVRGRRQVAHRFGGGSFASSSDPRLHFGLGAATTVDSVEVRWPSGRVDRYRDLEADTGYLLREAAPMPEPLAGFAKASQQPHHVGPHFTDPSQKRFAAPGSSSPRRARPRPIG